MNDNQPSSLPAPALCDLAAIQAQMQRPAQQVNLDGSFDLGWGTALLCMSLVPYVNAILPKAVWTSGWTSWIGFLPLVCGMFAPYAVGKIVKRFITWPRTGYVRSPNELTLRQLIMLAVFGLALGDVLGRVIVWTPMIYHFLNHTGARDDFHDLTYNVIRVLIAGTLTVYLGRKVIRKRPPSPSAYDATLINQQLNQTVLGKKCQRVVKLTLLFLFIGLPIVACGIVFGLMYLNHSGMRHSLFQWPQLGMASFIVGTNALLYLMGNAVAIRQQKWKWFTFLIMLLAPTLIAPLIPYPATQLDLLQTLPPVILSLGLVWFLSGAITLIIFIRHNPTPDTDTP